MLGATALEVLLQLFDGTTYDGDIIHKGKRDILVRNGLAKKCVGGWNVITRRGIKYLHYLDCIKPKNTV